MTSRHDGPTSAAPEDLTALLGSDQADSSADESRRRRRILTVCGVVLLLIGVVAGAFYGLTENIGNNVNRVPNVFGDLNPSQRPAAGVALTFLLVGTVGVDDTLSNGGLRSLALELRELRPSTVTFLSAPVSGPGQEGQQSVVYLDDVRSAEVWRAMSSGSVARYAAEYPADTLGSTTR